MQIVKYKEATTIMTRPDARKLFSGKEVELILLQLNQGETLENHINPQKVIFFIVSGKGILTYQDTDYEIAENTCIEIDANTERALKNSGKDLLKILVIKLAA